MLAVDRQMDTYIIRDVILHNPEALLYTDLQNFNCMYSHGRYDETIWGDLLAGLEISEERRVGTGNRELTDDIDMLLRNGSPSPRKVLNRNGLYDDAVDPDSLQTPTAQSFLERHLVPPTSTSSLLGNSSSDGGSQRVADDKISQLLQGKNTDPLLLEQTIASIIVNADTFLNSMNQNNNNSNNNNNNNNNNNKTHPISPLPRQAAPKDTTKGDKKQQPPDFMSKFLHPRTVPTRKDSLLSTPTAQLPLDDSRGVRESTRGIYPESAPINAASGTNNTAGGGGGSSSSAGNNLGEKEDNLVNDDPCTVRLADSLFFVGPSEQDIETVVQQFFTQAARDAQTRAAAASASTRQTYVPGTGLVPTNRGKAGI